MGYNSEWYKGYYMRNKKHKISTNTRWRQNNPEKLKEQRRRERCKRFQRIYGITMDDYERILDQQDGVCAICSQTEKKKLLAVDHCHRTNKVRGLLCAKCNQGIGHFDDNPQLMQKAIDYVRTHDSVR